MKRNPDLIRELLIYLEEKPTDEIVMDLDLDRHDENEIMYHFILMD